MSAGVLTGVGIRDRLGDQFVATSLSTDSGLLVHPAAAPLSTDPLHIARAAIETSSALPTEYVAVQVPGSNQSEISELPLCLGEHALHVDRRVSFPLITGE